VKALTSENSRRIIFGAGLGMAVFIMAQSAILSVAKLLNLDVRYSWLFLLPVALVAGLVAGAMSRQWGFAVGAVATSLMPLSIIAAGLAVIAAGGRSPTVDLDVASLLLHPIIGGLGGWMGAHWLPPIPFQMIQTGPERAAMSAALYFVGVAVVVVVLYTTAVPRLLLVAVVIAAGWGYGVYIWFRAKNRSERWRALVFVGMGGLLALMTLQTPEPPVPSPAAVVGLLVGSGLGALLMWRLYAGTRNSGNETRK
jgi:hypothetical protein